MTAPTDPQPPRLELLPAVDVSAGQAVRLVQGEAGSETGYGDPLEAALAWQAAGAEWIHLVDLDAAFGRGSNAELLAGVVTAVSALGVRVELSGGIRDDASLAAAMATGCARVNLGTAALEDPDWTRDAIKSFGDRIAVGLDVRGTTLAGRGWTREGGDLWQTLARLDGDGCARYVVTDVTKDGTLRGPNLELLRDVAARTDSPVVASGGISSLDDLRALRALVPLGVEGAIVGKALYSGAFGWWRRCVSQADSGADSHGVPWSGRTLTGQPFAGDDGSADRALVAALDELSAGTGALAAVVRAWAGSRVLVPIVAVLGEGDDVVAAAAAGQGDKSADMALVTITGRDGRRVLPAFSSTASLAGWNPTARPVPVEAGRAAQAAVLEGCDLVAIDPAGPVACLLPRPAVWAVAQGRDWLPPAEDPQVLAAVAAAAAGVPDLVAHRCEPDGEAGLNVVLGLPPGLDPEQVRQATGRLSALLAGDDLVAERAEALRLTLRTA